MPRAFTIATFCLALVSLVQAQIRGRPPSVTSIGPGGLVPYTRLNQNRYHYETTTGFSAEIQVDEMGLVTAYLGSWERLASR